MYLTSESVCSILNWQSTACALRRATIWVIVSPSIWMILKKRFMRCISLQVPLTAMLLMPVGNSSLFAEFRVAARSYSNVYASWATFFRFVVQSFWFCLLLWYDYFLFFFYFFFKRYVFLEFGWRVVFVRAWGVSAFSLYQLCVTTVVTKLLSKLEKLHHFKKTCLILVNIKRIGGFLEEFNTRNDSLYVISLPNSQKISNSLYENENFPQDGRVSTIFLLNKQDIP